MKKCAALLLSVLLLLAAVPMPFAFAENTVPEGYTPIYTLEDLDNIRLNMSGKYILMNDLTFTEADYAPGGDFYNSGKGWSPIGTNTNPFNGELNGNGFGIYNLKINAPSEYYAGLFGYAKNLDVNNLTLQGEVSGYSHCALLCGRLNGVNSSIPPLRVSGVTLFGSVTASGGYCGFVCGGIWSGSVTVSDTVAVGEVEGSIYVGGLIGYGSSLRRVSVCGCRFHGTVRGTNTGDTCVGGIIGCLSCFGSPNKPNEIVNCLVEGDISAAGSGVGGIVGKTTKESLSCVTFILSGSENIAAVSGRDRVGGIVGNAETYYEYEPYVVGDSYYCVAVTDCLNRGAVTASNGKAGGIVGEFDGSSDSYPYKSTIENCYNVGAVTGSYSGGLTAGGISESYSLPEAKPSYYLDTCVTNPTNTAGFAKSEDQLRKQSTFENWDFETVWQIDKTADYKFPTLRAIAALPEIEQPGVCAHENAYLRDSVEAACTEDGYTGDLYCPDCDTVLETGEVIPAAGHVPASHEAEAPTCTEPGCSAYTYCAVCKAELSEKTETPANGHTETTVGAVAATCGKDGYTGVTYCTVCEKLLSLGETIPATGNHTPTTVGEIPALCGRDGFTGVTYCTVCEKVLSVGTSIPATGNHTEGDPEETVLTAATCGAPGAKKLTVRCAVCDETLSETTEAIPATEKHTPGAAAVTSFREPTCAQEGLRVTTVTCTDCGAILSEKETSIGKLPHTDADKDGVCDVCRQELPAPETPAQNEAEACKYCGAVHPNNFFGKLTAFFHSILYFFAHMFGIK